MIAGVADTHAVLWYLYSDSRLGKAASRFIDQASGEGHQISLSAISLAEMVYLVEKSRIPATARLHQVPVLSRDGRIQSSNIQTVW